MPPAVFFENFALFADAPDAVGKMRELVLGLAFSGRLASERSVQGGLPKGWENSTIEENATFSRPNARSRGECFSPLNT